MWVYLRSEPGLFTVGYYTPNGDWQAESDWSNANDAADRVSYLNGGDRDKAPRSLQGEHTWTPLT